MIHDKSIICFANDWESDPTSKHHVMKILSKSNKILWINSIGMRRPTMTSSDFNRILAKIKGWVRGVTQVNENLYHFTPIVFPFPSSKIVRIINKYILIISIAFYKNKLNMHNVQLWTFLPNIVELVGSLGEQLLVYYCVDEWSKFSFMDGLALREMEIKLMRKADIVITTAEHLYHDKIQFNKNTVLVPHGVDYEFFSKTLLDETPRAKEMINIPKPIIGFFGLIHEWIDLELIEAIATSHPEWSIVLIGRVSADVSKLKSIQNVYFLGQKPYQELISYCKDFNVGLIPFRINELTINVNPIKLREYLAAGIPVASSALPEVEKYADSVEIGQTHKEIIEKIENIIENENNEKKIQRSKTMQAETWEKKVEYISEIITDTICDKNYSSVATGK